jgi:hypothetical protein
MRKLVLAVLLVLMASGAQAFMLDLVGGQLIGASDVLVDGSLYDVRFLDGSCITLYSRCDEASDFTFQTGVDNCLIVSDSDQANGDGDSLGDAGGNCPVISIPTRLTTTGAPSATSTHWRIGSNEGE